VQHSGDVAFQKAVLDKMTPLLGSDELDGQSYALLYDRIAVHDGRPQRYATQDAACQNGHHAVPRNIEDAGNLDRRRAEMGMGPIADYLRGLDEVYGACS
jgi:hypothetical protein